MTTMQNRVNAASTFIQSFLENDPPANERQPEMSNLQLTTIAVALHQQVKELQQCLLQAGFRGAKNLSFPDDVDDLEDADDSSPDNPLVSLTLRVQLQGLVGDLGGQATWARLLTKAINNLGIPESRITYSFEENTDKMVSAGVRPYSE